jgi:hypothetical protein
MNWLVALWVKIEPQVTTRKFTLMLSSFDARRGGNVCINFACSGTAVVCQSGTNTDPHEIVEGGVMA